VTAMDPILRAAAIYVFLLCVFRVAGKRTLSETTTFDLVLLLVIAEATQQALTRDDYSVTNAALIILTLLLIDVALSLLKQRSPRFERLVDGVPIIIVVDGKPLRERMDRERIDEEDVLEQARTTHGLERLEQIKYAVLERNGHISIVPRR
jgi:uncharacterized membrane protein YcaP (DUF421 family)